MCLLWVYDGGTSPTTNVLAFSVQLQHLVIKLKYNVIIADNGAPNETQKNKQTSKQTNYLLSNNFFNCTLLNLILSKGSWLLLPFEFDSAPIALNKLTCVWLCCDFFLTHYIKFKFIVLTFLRKKKEEANLLSILIMTEKNSEHISLCDRHRYIWGCEHTLPFLLLLFIITFFLSLTEFKLICEELPYCFLAFSVYISGQLMSIA